MLPDRGKDAEKRGEPCRRLPFFLPFFLDHFSLGLHHFRTDSAKSQ